MMNKKQIGNLGENIATIYLNKNSFNIVDRNFQRRWGEIDIVAQKEGKLYFVEVKTVTYNYNDVIHETSRGEYRAEDNINPWKIRKLQRIIQTYLFDNDLYDSEWCLVGVIVKLNLESRIANVAFLKDIL